MGRRPLLGGAKRRERERRQHEDQRTWQQQTQQDDVDSDPGEAVPSRTTSESPAGSAAGGTHQPDVADLRWVPVSQAEPGAAPGEASGRPGEAEPIPWTISDGTRSWDDPQPQQSTPHRSQQHRMQEEQRVDDLTTISRQQQRNLRLARSGWLLLGTAVLLTVVLSLL